MRNMVKWLCLWAVVTGLLGIRGAAAADDAKLSGEPQQCPEWVNLLDRAKQLEVEKHGQRHAVRVALDSHEIGIYRLA